MIIGIGTDIVRIERIERLLLKFGDKFIFRILSSQEILKFNENANKTSFLAKRFAAKEAVAKALGTGFGVHLFFKDIIISNNDMGCPLVFVDRDIAQGKNILLSIADEMDVAIAFAVISQ